MAIRSRNKVNVNFNMSSMTDMVFLLLIFVLIIAQFKHDTALNVLVPNTPTQNPAPEHSVSVGVEQDPITRELVYFINKRSNIVPFDQIGQIVKAEMAGKTTKNVMLEIEQQVPTQNTMELISLLNEYGFNAAVKTEASN